MNLKSTSALPVKLKHTANMKQRNVVVCHGWKSVPKSRDLFDPYYIKGSQRFIWLKLHLIDEENDLHTVVSLTGGLSEVVPRSLHSYFSPLQILLLLLYCLLAS
jgi:hypothetical protein